jgi:hypothetical protein
VIETHCLTGYFEVVEEYMLIFKVSYCSSNVALRINAVVIFVSSYIFLLFVVLVTLRLRLSGMLLSASKLSRPKTANRKQRLSTN